MRDHRSERSDVVEVEDDMAEQQPSSGLRGLLGGPIVLAFVGWWGSKRTEILASVNREGMVHI